jgi:aryl-alcohol dehydrogenase-like predicted oxidoreductase
MRVRELGLSGVQVSVIGFGAWGIGGSTDELKSYGTTDDDVSQLTLLKAYDVGINFFDTAPAYGNGHSERLIGETFSDIKRETLVFATKGGWDDFNKSPDYSNTALQKGLESSLERLATDYIDLYQLHSPSLEILQRSSDLNSLISKLKDEGIIKAFGVSTNSPEEAIKVLESLRPDTLQVNFNLMDQRAIDCGLFDMAYESGSSIIARTPLCFGLLSGKVSADQKFSSNDHRSRWKREQIELWINGGKKIMSLINEGNDITPIQQALRYCISYPIVATTIPGMLMPDEVIENVKAEKINVFSDDILDKIREIYKLESFIL